MPSAWEQLVTDLTDVEFGKVRRMRRAQDVLPVLGEILAVWDFMVCALSAEAARFVLGRAIPMPRFDLSLRGMMSHDIFWGSLALALALRDTTLINPRQGIPTSHLVWSAEKRCLFGFALLIGIVLAYHSVSRMAETWLFCWLAIFACMVALSRWALGAYLERLQDCGGLREAVAVIGASGPRSRLAARLSAAADVVGVYGAHPPDQLSQDDIVKLLELGRGGAVDSVVVAAEAAESGDVAELLERLKVLPVEVAVCADRDWLRLPGPEVRIVGGVPMTVVAGRPIKRRDLLFKTLFDKLAALALLAFCMPLMLGISLAIGMSSEGPIIFRQVRQGFCGRDFTLFKFRTMHIAPSGVGWLSQTERNDVRCTSVGKFLRRTSLDELPQLWNVFVGDMSLVGPRPHVDYLHGIDRAGREIVAEYAQRNRVKPGITGWAQIHGSRGPTNDVDQLRQRVAYDLYYIEHWSIWLDIQILFRTAFCLFGENAY
jgi:exopolysaccharide biosynthesis polyprenyl glycosylphosphotransferase